MFTRAVRIVAAVLVVAGSLAAQTENAAQRIAELRASLPKFAGADRLAVLTELVELCSAHLVDDALSYGRLALDQLEHTPDPPREATVRLHLSRLLNRRGDNRLALEQAVRALELSTGLNTSRTIADSQFEIGVAHFRMANHLLALSAARTALELFEQFADRRMQSRTLGLIGAAHRGLDDLEKALASHVAALRIEEQLDSRTGIGRTTNNIGLVYVDLSRPEPARDHFLRAAESFRAPGSEVTLARVLNNLGLAYDDLGEYDKALEAYGESLAIKEKQPDRATLARTLANVGDVHEKLEQYAPALEKHLRALELRRQHHDHPATARSLGSLGRLHRSMSRLADSLRYLDEALALAKSVDARSEQSAIQRQRAETLAAMDRHADALVALREHKGLSDSINENRRGLAVEKLRVAYESDRKEREIDLLRKDQTIHELEMGRQEARLLALVASCLVLALIAFRLYRRGQARLITQRQLEDSERRYRRLFEDPATPKLLIDLAAGTVLDANSSACALTGLARIELTRQPIAALPVRWLDSVLRDVAKDPVHPVHRVVRTSSEETEPRDFELWGSLLKINGHSSLLVTMRDITEQSRLEDDRLRADKLESLGLLAGGIAHDFNNALAGILGNVTLAQVTHDDTAELTELLAEAEQATMHAHQLTGQLLALSKGGEPVREMQDIGRQVREASNIALSGSSHEARIEVSDGLWPVDCDAAQMRQLVQNLVLNAAQITPEGGAIDVRVGNFDLERGDAVDLPPGPYVRVEVHDSGPGIPIEIRDKVFDPYFTTKPNGCGLGLTTAHAIVRRHEGAIRFTTSERHGTTFEFLVPASPSRTVVKDELPATTRSGVGRVLIVDDEPSIRRLYRRSLTKLGYQSEVAADGEAALERYRQALRDAQPFDAVIMDLTIRGGVSGDRALQALRELDPAVRAIVASGYSDAPILSEYRAAGFASALSKPFTLEDLSRALARAFQAGPTE